VTEAVLDASVILKWFRTEGERNVAEARSLRRTFTEGELVVFAPPLVRLELVDVAGRRWRWRERRLVALANALDELAFQLRDPELTRVARWTARGLTAYDAAYVALAEEEGIQLFTDDDVLATAAGEIATSLGESGVR
jgi:predicted nucleic acid-binding protein